MITNLHTQLTEILGGIVTSCNIQDDSFGFVVEYTEKYPLYAYKEETFKELLSNLFDVNECDISFHCKDIPTIWTMSGVRISGWIDLTVSISNIPKYIIDQLIKSDKRGISSIGYFTTKQQDV